MSRKLSKGIIAPYERKACHCCGAIKVNNSVEYANAGVVVKWYSLQDNTIGIFFDEYTLWCCSVVCAEASYESHVGMKLLAKVEL